MEMTVVMTSFAVGGALVLPSLWAAMKPHLPKVAGGAVLLVAIILLSPTAPHEMWEYVGSLPGEALHEATSEVARFNSAYYDAFH